MPVSRPITPQTLFAQGQFEDLLASTLRARNAPPHADDWAYVASALALTGKAVEAEELLRVVGAGMSAPSLGFAWYHVNPARLRPIRRQALFDALQALARAYFAKGVLTKSLRVADSASALAAQAFDPAQARRTDAELRLHLHGMRGELALAEAAYRQSSQTSSLALSRALYQARHGGGMDALAAVNAEFPAQIASLQLERARLQLVARKIDAGQRSLAKAAAALEPLRLPRFDRCYALRRIDLAIVRGEIADALVQLRVFDAALGPDDAILAFEAVSREVACLRFAGRHDELADAARRFSGLKQRTGYVVPPHPAPRPGEHDALSPRQRTFLAEMATGALAHVHAYQRRFDVSEITACRDLAALVAHGSLKRLGKARATRYVKVEPSADNVGSP